MDEPEEHLNIHALLPSLGISLMLILGVYTIFQFSKPRTSQIILPGGITYLGPSPSPTATLAKAGTLPTQSVSDKIPIPSDVSWVQTKGNIYPYTFSYPSSLSLGVFPNDPTDGVTVFYETTDPQSNLFFRVEVCKGSTPPAGEAGCGIQYARSWWKQYTWKGVDTVTTFINGKGLKGYRVAYLDASGTTPYDHVFLEVPGRNDLIIWVSGKIFAPADFDRLVESVAWGAD